MKHDFKERAIVLSICANCDCITMAANEIKPLELLKNYVYRKWRDYSSGTSKGCKS